MSDNNGDKPDFVSKSDLQVMLATLEQKATERETAFKKELDIQANQIHSSYAKKLKKLGVSSEGAGAEDENEDAPNRKPTKKEAELQTNLEKLLKEMDDQKAQVKQAKMRQSVTEQLMKSGINPKAVDTLYTLFNARQALVEGEDGSVKLKVDVEGGANVALPMADALKHFVKSDEGQLFMAPLGTAGSGAKTPNPAKTDGKSNGAPHKSVDVDWGAVADDMKWGQ